MPIETVRIGSSSPYLDDVLYVLHTQFPEGEWESREQITRMLDKDENIYRLRGYLDENDFVGFSFTIDVPERTFAYLLYLGVRGECQGKGYGAQMLAQVKEEAGCPILLAVESLTEKDADNYEQRQRRIRFYNRNGLHTIYEGLVDKGLCYDLLCDSTDIDEDEIGVFFATFSALLCR